MPERNEDAKFMKKALALALRGRGCTSPNPVVGAVIVSGGEIIGRGYHKRAGLPHAEIEAFADAEKKRRSTRGATLYVTLEPCCHTDKLTPPCTDAVISSGVSRVVVGTVDPNPKVSGRGIEKLRAGGLEVDAGILEARCRGANEFFNKHVVSGLPFVILKAAATLDGKIATATGDSKWIGSSEQRKMAHRMRRDVDAVVVGINTLLTDDPRLTARTGGANVRQPVPVVMDTRLVIPDRASIFRRHPRSVIATVARGKPARTAKLEARGAEIVRTRPDSRGKVCPAELLRRLGEMGMCGVLVEGGAEVGAAFLREGLVDKAVFFYSPRIMGGDGKSMVAGLGTKSVDESVSLKDVRTRRFGDEIMVEGYL